ncbi:MAG: anion transporter [Kiritimatiellae bacterium]|nr:anion transporter [Kiritimatiellia bacterium]
MPLLPLTIFVLTYLGIALGEVPGLKLDRTGMALLGALAMVVAGVLSEAEAMASIDVPTILLLYGLMVVSSQLRLGGFYTWVALRITATLDRPRRFLLAMMCVSAALSAVLANDIVCLAFTPVLTVALLAAGLNPVPFLIGLAVSSNIGSAATIIGNPQNMLIGQVGGLDFGRFFLWCAVPSVLSLAAGYGVILLIYRQSLGRASAASGALQGEWPAFDRHQSVKGLVVTAVLVLFFFTRVPRELSALCAAGVLLCSRRMSTRAILGYVDWHLITLFCGLFIVIRGLQVTGVPDALVSAAASRGVQIADFRVLTVLSVALSNLVSNVPATMILVQFLDRANPVPWYVLAMATTYAGNLITIGSIANLIVIEQAREHGVKITFREHARIGIPVTVISIVIMLFWIILLA